MMKSKSIQLLFPLISAVLFLTSCIGTDVLEISEVEAKVKITLSVSTLKLGTSFQLGAVYINEYSMIEQKEFTWTSSDPDIITVSEEGNITGISLGTATITVAVGSIDSSLDIEVTDTTTGMGARTGTFMGLTGHSVSGSFKLEMDGPNLVLTLNSDFNTQTGPGLYVYLSNMSENVSGGSELGELQAPTGMQQYTVPAGVEPGTYDHVIVYCKPFGVPFGTGQLN